MENFQWGHLISGVVGAVAALVSRAFFGGIRIGQMQGAVDVKIADSERAMKQYIAAEVGAFDETFKGLRQKINDVELDVERRFLSKDDFNDFREEIRQDFREVKSLIRNGHS